MNTLLIRQKGTLKACQDKLSNHLKCFWSSHLDSST